MKRSLRTEKIGDLINRFVDKKSGKTDVNNDISFPSLWLRIVGKQVAAETKNIRFQNNTLYLSILNPYLKRDLVCQKAKILERIKELNPNVSQIIFD